MPIHIAQTDADIRRCFPVMVQLRPHLTEDVFLAQVRRQHDNYGYSLAFVEDDGEVRAVAGYRISECLFGGRFLYVDDLVTDVSCRSQGYGDALFDWLTAQARDEGCASLELESGTHRHDAHRFYFRKRMRISSYHFLVDLPS
jgi:GNAT superfamily N-acetyltransferase